MIGLPPLMGNWFVLHYMSELFLLEEEVQKVQQK